MAFDIRDEDDPHNDEFEEYEEVKQAERPKFYRRRKFWMFCIPSTIVIVVVAVVLILYVIMPKIAQGLMNKATINFSQIDISNPSPTSMDIVMQGDMKHTGPFHVEISFPGTVDVSWNGIQLGTTEIPGTSSASGGHGSLDLQSSFSVTNSSAFAEFSSYMLNAESFVWHLEGKINVKALGRTIKNLNLKKDITVNAFNGMTGVAIQKFSLPGDDPNGDGIIVEIDTALTNPSAIQMYMGSLTLAISYKDTLVGYVTSNNLTLVRGSQTLSLKGVLIPQNTTEGLANTSELMSNYIGNFVSNTTATGYEVKPDGVNSVDWLSAAIKNLKLTVPLQSPEPLQLIKSLNLGALGLVFTPSTAYEPVTTSTGVLANYTLPDGFDFKIQFTQVANSFTLSRDNVPIANLNSSYNPSTSNMEAGTLTFDLTATPLIVPEESHEAFQEFNRDLTTGSDLPFDVVGKASVYANTSIGVVNLVNIPFNASTELSGLQSLANPAPTITSLQVASGTSTSLTMDITVVIVNPSSISLNAGDIVLDLVYSGVRMGTVTMPNLAIVPGANSVNATSTIDPAASPEGLELLSLYTSGTGASVSIVGTSSSTAVESLTLAFGALDIGSQIPGLQAKLLVGASLTVLDTTVVNGMAQTVVTVNNPFIPPMTILSIDSKITYNGVSVGTVVSTFSSPPVIPGIGQGAITASLAMNTNTEDLVTLIRTQAVKNGLNTDAFDGLISIMQGGNPPSSLFNGFSVGDFVVKAMAGLSVDITMTTTVKLGDYQVTIPYTQTGVPTDTDQSILKLVPLVGTPIAQILVGQAALTFDSINILSPSETSFQTDIVGAITNTGPLDAQIQFPNVVTISYNDKTLGSLVMPTVDAVAGKGADLNLTAATFTVLDAEAFADFNVFAVNNEKFEWTVSSSGLVVNAMGVSLPGVNMTKTVTLDGFNKLPGLQLMSYIITNIDDQGLHMAISASISNPSTIGMTIPTSTFNTVFHGKVLGPAVAVGLTLVPHGTSSFALNATIAAGNGDLTPYLTGIFQNAVSGVSTELDAQGESAPGVSWLDAAIKALNLQTSLPPLSEPPIESVSIDAMSMDFTCDTCVWAPTAISTITAKTNLPFANGAPIVQLSQHVNIMDQNGQIVGTLNTPYASANASGNMVTTSTPSEPLTIADGSHEIFESFIGDLNAATTYQLGLNGTSDSILDLGVLGQIEVKGIKLDVQSPLDGLQGLKTIDFLAPLGIDSVATDTTVYVRMKCLVNIINPSKLTLKIGSLTMNAGLDYTEDGYFGQVSINGLELVPGNNAYLAVALLDSNLPNTMTFVMSVLGGSTDAVPMYVYPSSDSTSNPALSAGLKDLQSIVYIPPLFQVPGATPPYSNSSWKITFLSSTLEDSLVEMTATFQNPYLNTVLNFEDAVVDQTEFAAPLSTIGIMDPGTHQTISTFDFLNNFQYSLGSGESKVVTFKVKIDPGDGNPALMSRASVERMVEASKSGSLSMTVNLFPVFTFGSDPTRNTADWSSSNYYSTVPLETGSDFSLFLDWYDKYYPSTAASVASTTVSSVPSATTVSTTTPSPVVTPTTTSSSATSPDPSPAPSSVPTPATSVVS
ncbi:hypothetical protein BGX21_006210 [Mortierella sp. AD011]|nr:hypothetical protein BGX20_010449 [Mortierella sp. AD010]KAF9403214.1 hypothetical protein BGX21_006210 [Mortierella sp. AD011]